ncbi:hypothetical protein AB0F18_02875 [Streptomyces sp. NPDC029216]|uniref:hypothetical protein n=1 Tax=Streptomyces sp. NPDC029216 TaxID=3154701 RepID=UPI0033C6356F
MVTVAAPFTGPLAHQGYRLYRELLDALHRLPGDTREPVLWRWIDTADGAGGAEDIAAGTPT